MNRSKASEHYQDLLMEHGTLDERRAEAKARPLGFARPQSVTVGYIHPRGIETQAWEEWNGDDD